MQSVTERRWDDVSSKLKLLSEKVAGLRRRFRDDFPTAVAKHSGASLSPSLSRPKSIVISGHPARPPLVAVACVKALAKSGSSVWAKTHVHCSVSVPPKNALDFLRMNDDQPRTDHDFAVTYIWRSDAGADPSMCVSDARIRGEADILRYFSRVVKDKAVLPYEDGLSPAELAQVDSKLDDVVRFERDSEKRVSLKSLISGKFVAGKTFSIADVLLHACLTRKKELNNPVCKAWASGVRKMAIIQ